MAAGLIAVRFFCLLGLLQADGAPEEEEGDTGVVGEATLVSLCWVRALLGCRWLLGLPQGGTGKAAAWQCLP